MIELILSPTEQELSTGNALVCQNTIDYIFS